MQSTIKGRTPLGNITNVFNNNASPSVPSLQLTSNISSPSPEVPTVTHNNSVPEEVLHDHCYVSQSFVCSTPMRKVSRPQELPSYDFNSSTHCSPISMKKNNPAFDTCDVSENTSILKPSVAHQNDLEISSAAVDSSQENLDNISTSCVELQNYLETSAAVEPPKGNCDALTRLDALSIQSMEAVRARVLAVEKENEMLRAKVSSIDKLTKEVFTLRGVVRRERKAKYRVQETLNLTKLNVSKVLSPDQLNALGRKSTRGMKRTAGGISEGLYYRSQSGGSCYSDMAKRFLLPSRRTLSARTQHIKFRSGILLEVFEQLAAVVPSLSDKEKDCHMCFDEMAIDPNDKLYDPSTKSGIGQCTLPGHTGTAAKAFVVMICGISSRWKLVVAYYYSGNRDQKLHKDEAAKALWKILGEILTRAEDCGLKVSSFSSDMGAENRALWRVLGICGKRRGKLKTFIPHPCDDTRRLHILPDIPHLFKNIVHMLQANKFIILPPNIVKTHDLPSNVVVWDHIKYLMEHEVKFELKIAFRLLEEHMKSGHFEKMQVGRAKAIFNDRTAAGLTILADKKNRPEYKVTAWFISLVVRWFDLVTSRSHACALSHGNEDAHAKAIAHIRLTSTVFQTMKVGKAADWKPSQEGVMIASRSIINLQEYYLGEREYKFLLTARFNQDCLENLFSQIRRRNPTPNALLFKNVLRGICLSGKTCRPPRSHGYDYDDGELLIDVLLNWKDESGSVVPDTTELDLLHCPPITDSDVYAIFDDWELMPIYDMAGAAVHKAMETHKIRRNCPCVQAFCWQGVPGSHHPCSPAVLEKNYKDGALIEVSNECFMAIAKCELIFRMLRTTLLKGKGLDVIGELCKRSAYVWENIQCPPCHGDFATKVMNRYVRMRWKQYGLKGKKDMAEAAAIFSSKCHAMNKFVKNIHVHK